MNKKRLILILIGSLVLFAVLVGFLSVRSRVRRTESVLGPASDALSVAQRIRLTLRCSGMLESFGKPVNSAVGQLVLEITEQENVTSVIDKIAGGLNFDPDLLRTYWIYTGADRHIRPGRYVLTGELTIPLITDLVTAAGKSLVQFAFLSGMRLEELAALIDQSGLSFSGEEFLVAAKNYPPELHPAGETSLEGYFVPGSYEMSRNISLDDFLSNFVRVFENRVKLPYEEAFKANGLTLHQGVILSSMIAKEAMSASEYAVIASVFYNRIRAGMKFESDPTAQYALGWDPGSNSWWKNPLTATDVSVYSPYNTYVTDGFPPGPICSPGTDVVEAAAYPDQTDYYYFRARCDNTPYHNFSKTFEEHVSYACK